jgi:hypothetical protein
MVDRVEGEGILMLVSSESVYGLEYELFINEHGQVACSCMDRICRRKTSHILRVLEGDFQGTCKHVRAFALEYQRRNKLND